ncbi:hypothetical protein Nepgr_032862 [Nepenthes gracilis]|uniref:RING-type domain-containing protein n=1 Tax=Nepenthes gracilis TaxID=150966 RepID=A0AAD3Y877_NEPGR|nr:hypothetical protein Nepgr_032862 [Nepenthes gracilis]
MGRGSGGGASSRLRNAVRKIIVLPCGSFSSSRLVDPSTTSISNTAVAATCSSVSSSEIGPLSKEGGNELIVEEGELSSNAASKNVCTICLEPLMNNNGAASPGHAVFTSQCSHAFHLACISSNIRHGNATCPICRAHWTRLPHTLYPPCWLPRNHDDPILRILNDSITTFQVHRRSFLRSARYDDDEPVEPEGPHSRYQPHLYFTLTALPVPQSHPTSNLCSYAHYPSHNMNDPFPYHSPALELQHQRYENKRAAYLSVGIAPQQATDLVLVASPNGPHLRLLKQSMALVVFSLRPVDRLAIVSYSSAAARIFPLRRMTAYHKQAALQVIERLFYAGHANPMEGIKKGIKILKDRAHKNPRSSILHLSDHRTSVRSYQNSTEMDIGMPISLNQFHVASTVSIMHELEEFLAQLLGGRIREVQLRIGDEEEARIVRLGDLRGNDERRILLEIGESCAHICVGYSYLEGGVVGDEQIRTGEVLVRVGDTRETGNAVEAAVTAGRGSSVESWDYLDPCMARRWAKRLHGR